MRFLSGCALKASLLVLQEDLDKEHAKERAERHLRHEFRLMEIEEEDKKESDEHDNGTLLIAQ